MRLLLGCWTSVRAAAKGGVVWCGLLIKYVVYNNHRLNLAINFYYSLFDLGRCPSGDDPDTTVDETNCFGVVPSGGSTAGEEGNLCHVDCANRGICDYSNGQCSCFDGYYGQNCTLKDIFATSVKLSTVIS